MSSPSIELMNTLHDILPVYELNVEKVEGVLQTSRELTGYHLTNSRGFYIMDYESRLVYTASQKLARLFTCDEVSSLIILGAT